MRTIDALSSSRATRSRETGDAGMLCSDGSSEPLSGAVAIRLAMQVA